LVYPCPPTSHTACGQQALQYISPKRIEEENPSVIFHSSFSSSGWFIPVLQLLTLHVGSALQYISPKRIEEENPSAIFPFSMSDWFIFALVGGKHCPVYLCQRESNRETQMTYSFLLFPVAFGLSLSFNFSHCMWAAGTTVYFTKENRREKPKCHLPFFPLFNDRFIYLCSCG
jgi:hypothetical protein